ncbi:hypothetical protein [Acidisoma cladoniae]|jgi:hypothetical protein|uniref:hypothetical protein n=1 Tax=Acidisoma cladoniae TaxID=3040935 RepID=UPI002550D85D|nr:hypothetical protein [Acidisoma sp. PAMC 29798]
MGMLTSSEERTAERILSKLHCGQLPDLGELLFLGGLVEQLLPQRVRQRRHLDQRDALIVEASYLVDEPSETSRCDQVAADLEGYLRRQWPQEKLLAQAPGGDPYTVLLHQIAHFTDGEKISGRQVLRIVRGERTPIPTT